LKKGKKRKTYGYCQELIKFSSFKASGSGCAEVAQQYETLGIAKH
jgi:hypothetical protein